ncbi:PEP/pyruvate-binding domain-containing protein [Phaeodactylibacter luteus]|uniref:Phosphoenolpyruvate synthase n=1 Tax=Phaeodactylibacter luteus TaxID=1564516 RepID=A0A5C6RGJ2_9BACT|nr:PEP/pyruvate-binding domain-containing protein [Phaeodactylibacter luteus]TXB61427.1 hypothetical protein FRY97_19230 [Phaeodactylibacter luteus]
MHSYTIHTATDCPPEAAVGGKAQGLLFLKGAGFRVPLFFIMPHSLLQAVIDGRARLPDVLQRWQQGHGIAEAQLWAVRSSAGQEDGEQHSFAGLFHTEINVPFSGLEAAIGRVLAAFGRSSRLRAYRPTEEEEPFGIVLQEMVAAELSGVVFSDDPQQPGSGAVVANVVPGLGDNLVSGRFEAFHAREIDGEFYYPNHGQEYVGEYFKGGERQEARLTAQEMEARLQPCMRALAEGAKALHRLKGKPLDIEFAIAGQALYWLQVRPITTAGAAALPNVWDNANIGENYPGLTLPLSISFTRYTYTTAYTAMVAFLGMPKEEREAHRAWLENLVGGIYGGLYYQVTAWQKLLYLLPFGRRASRLITKAWAMEEAPFEPPEGRADFRGYLLMLYRVLRSFLRFPSQKKHFEHLYAQVFEQYGEADFQGMPRERLIVAFQDIHRKLGEKWIVPVLNGFFTLLLFSLLKRVVRGSRLQGAYPNFVNDILYAQDGVVSVRIVQDFQALLRTILSAPRLKALFQAQPAAVIQRQLEEEHPGFLKQISAYISQYGERCGDGELKIETVNYKEDPLSFIAFLKANAIGEAPKARPQRQFDYRSALRSVYPFRPLRRYLAQWLVQATIPRFRDRENYRFYRTRSFHIMRRIFRALDLHLHRTGAIQAIGDSLYLELHEVLGPAPEGGFQELVASRKTAYEAYAKRNRAVRYHERNGHFLPVRTRALAIIGSLFQGIGCSSGAVTAEAVLITEGTSGTADIDGKILVAAYFEPGWINLFSRAAGVISERGNLLSHTAILCREMGIPAIVGVRGIANAVQDGSVIQMDGATGEVKIGVEKQDA